MRDFLVFVGPAFAMVLSGVLILWWELHLAKDEPIPPIDEDPRPRWRRWLTTFAEYLTGLGIFGCIVAILGIANVGVATFPGWIGTLMKLWFGAVLAYFAYQTMPHSAHPATRTDHPPAPDPPAQTAGIPDP